MNHTITLSNEELDLIGEGLGELPAKRSLPLILKLSGMLVTPEQKVENAEKLRANGTISRKRGRPKKVKPENKDGVVALDS